VKIIRIGRREYETADGRFHAFWDRRLGTRSRWTVVDRKTQRHLRAFKLAEVRETIRNMIADHVVERGGSPGPFGAPMAGARTGTKGAK
jgi:hypothetical protein